MHAFAPNATISVFKAGQTHVAVIFFYNFFFISLFLFTFAPS